MAKKKDKVALAAKKARTAAKAEKISAKKNKKASSKPGKDDDSDAESDVDLDAVLASYAAQQEQFLKVTETVCEPPSARSSATFIANPSNGNELLLFGGEHFNGSLARFFNDLFVYNTARDEWRLVRSPNTPLPRSGHAWCRGGNQGGLWLFGGEFSSPKQGTFYHYGDFWRLEEKSREWTKVDTKKGPPGRSGHRMTYFKQYIVLFGGFQDTSSTTKYLSDLWLYDTNNFQWHNPVLPPASQKPDPRSSFSLLPHESGAVLYGGYSRVKTTAGPTRQAKSGPSAASSRGGVLKPLVHQDTWFLRVTLAAPDAAPNAPPTVRWERRKRPTNPPNPARAGATMAYHRGRGIQFGGVHDVEASEEGIDSEFFNTLFVWNIDRNRFFSLALRRPKVGQKKTGQAADRGRRQRGKADEEELLRNLAALEMKSGGGEGELPATLSLEEPKEEEPTIEKPVLWEMPHPRFNGQLTIQNDVLFIYGGTYEKGDREYTFEDMYAVDLDKLDGVKEVFRREVEDWQGSDSEDSEEDDEGGSDDDEDDDGYDSSNEDHEPKPVSSPNASKKSAAAAAAAVDATQSDEAILEDGEVEAAAENDQQTSSLNDSLPHPRPFETLRDFYARTSQQWQAVLLHESESNRTSQGKSIKEMRKGAFERSEEKWWDCREEIHALEDEQEEAGITEIVSLADKTASDNTGGVGRRR